LRKALYYILHSTHNDDEEEIAVEDEKKKIHEINNDDDRKNRKKLEVSLCFFEVVIIKSRFFLHLTLSLARRLADISFNSIFKAMEKKDRINLSVTYTIARKKTYG
jgi:hypothetical protein